MTISNTPSLAHAPDLLLFGSEVGVDAMHKALLATGDAVSVMPVVVDMSAPDAVLHDMAVQACTTYGAAALMLASNALSLRLADNLKAVLDIPVYTVLPPLAESARLTCTRHVALMAQPSVLDHPATRRQLALFAERGLRVTPVSATGLVYMAHRHLRDGALPDIGALRDQMAAIRADVRIDTVILAAAHATRLRGMLEKAAFRPFYWVDAITCAANHYHGLRAVSATATTFSGRAF